MHTDIPPIVFKSEKEREMFEKDPRLRVRVWLILNKKTQGDLAEDMGITQSTLSLILKEKREPSPGTAIRFRDVCGIPVDLWYEVERDDVGID